jgi:hypothetical protein
MSNWNPKSLWDELKRTFEGWTNDDEEQSSDPTLLFHLMFTAPLLIGLLTMLRKP